jgi:antitoxin component of MazEF toxin-antitoxin module
MCLLRGESMTLTTRIFEQGNSYAVVIPKHICEVLEWKPGVELEVDLIKTNDKQVVILKK